MNVHNIAGGWGWGLANYHSQVKNSSVKREKCEMSDFLKFGSLPF